MRVRSRTVVAVSVAAAALAITAGMAAPHAAPQDLPSSGPAGEVDDGAHVAQVSTLHPSGGGDRVVRASRSLSRTARGILMVCPTKRRPGCALSFIRNDAGARIHPVYGYRSCHTGIDLRGRYGDPVRAAASGRVIKVVYGDPAYGNFTLVQDNETIRTMYAHQSRVVVRPGDRIGFGQVIGYVGSTGFATGPHLHFEVHVDRRPYDPAGWFGGADRHPVACYPGLKY